MRFCRILWRSFVAIAMLLATIMGCLSGCGSSGKESLISGENQMSTTPKFTVPQITEAPTTEPVNSALSAKEVAELTQAATVTVTVDCGEYGTSTGSGFFIDDQGTLVTNYHVIDGGMEMEVEIFGGGRYKVTTVVDFDVLHDIAILKIDYTGNPYLKICEDAVVTGETVYANGSSLGVLDGSFSDGIVSSPSRKVGMIDCIQITAPISNGNSGGPLVNEFGEVIGINSFGYSSGQNLNLAININTIKMLPCDKNWTISRYMQWYDKEVDRSYLTYDPNSGDFYLSKDNM